MTDNVVVDAPVADAPVVNAEPMLNNDPAPVESPRDKFIQSLPEEYRADPVFARFNDWNDVAKSYSNAAKMVGMDKNQIVALPKEPTPEAMAPIWDKLGRPADANGYGLDQFKDVLPIEVTGKYADIAHKHGVSKDALSALIGEFVNESKTGQSAMEAQQAQQVGQWQQEVKQEFGMAYNEKITFAQKAVEKFGLTEAIKENPNMFEHPAIIKALVAIGEKTSEGIVLANGDVNHGKLAPNEAKMELAKFTSDPDVVKILMDKRNPQHEFMMKRKSELFKYAHPD